MLCSIPEKLGKSSVASFYRPHSCGDGAQSYMIHRVHYSTCTYTYIRSCLHTYSMVLALLLSR